MKTGPDRGYCWVILGATFFSHFVLYGIFRSSGILYVAFLRTFGVTREEASWPFSLVSAVCEISGLISSFLTHYMTVRKICCLGSVIATLGIISCYFTENFFWITISYGVVYGIGFGMIAALTPAVINRNFIRFRSTAMGIAFAGGPLSSFVFPKGMEFLLDTYDLSGTFLILGGFVMNTLVSCALLRESPWLEKRPCNESPKISSYEDHCNNGISDKRYSARNINFTRVEERKLNANESTKYEMTSDDSKRFRNEILPVVEEIEPLVQNKENNFLTEKNSYAKLQKDFSDKNKINDCETNNKCEMKQIDKQFNHGEKRNHLVLIFNKNEMISIIPVKEVCLQGKQNRKRNLFFANVSVVYQSVANILFRPVFHLLVFSQTILLLALFTVFMVIVDYSKDKGLTEDKVIYVFPIFSAMDVLGRTGFGWVTDRQFVSRKSTTMSSFAFIGLLLNIYPFVNTFTEICILTAFHGLVTGITVISLYTQFGDYLDVEQQLRGFGLSHFIVGISVFLQPSMIGFFRDFIGSYNWMFHLLGCLSFVVVSLWFAEPWLKKKDPVINHSTDTRVAHC